MASVAVVEESWSVSRACSEGEGDADGAAAAGALDPSSACDVCGPFCTALDGVATLAGARLEGATGGGGAPEGIVSGRVTTKSSSQNHEPWFVISSVCSPYASIGDVYMSRLYSICAGGPLFVYCVGAAPSTAMAAETWYAAPVLGPSAPYTLTCVPAER